MTAFWPSIEDQLAELNLLARTRLGGGSRERSSRTRSIEPLAWPDWAPAPGSWIRQAVIWNSGRRSTGATWHIAGPVLWEAEWDYGVDGRIRRDFNFKPLCGREVRVHRPGDAFDHISLEVRLAPAPDDRECWHCRRKLALIGKVGPGHRYFVTRTASRS
jgi:hypothetical protein